MNLDDYRFLFATGTSLLLIVGILPLSTLYFSFPRGTAKFTELWVLGPEETISGYPFTIMVNKSSSLRVGVRNHMGHSVYYVLYVKFRNQTEPLPDTINLKPSPVPELYEFNFFLKNGEKWEPSINLTITDVLNMSDTLFVRKIRINDSELPINSYSIWDSVNHGFYYQIFFELWLYNVTTGRLQFHDRFVSIWLNVTTGQGGMN